MVERIVMGTPEMTFLFSLRLKQVCTLSNNAHGKTRCLSRFGLDLREASPTMNFVTPAKGVRGSYSARINWGFLFRHETLQT